MMARVKQCCAVLICLCIFSNGRAHGVDAVVVAVPYLPVRLDLRQHNEPVTRVILANTAPGLAVLSAAGAVEAHLAQQIARTSDELHWAVQLRPNLRFPGERLAALRDLRASLVLMCNGDCAGKKALPGDDWLVELQNIEEISVLDAAPGSAAAQSGAQVVYSLRVPSKKFPLLLTLFPVCDADVSLGFGAASFGMGTKIACAAPYVIAENAGKERIVLERTSQYFRPGRPVSPRVELRRYQFPQNALRALRLGEVQIILLPAAELAREAAQDESLAVVASPLVNLRRVTGSWKLLKEYWTDAVKDEERLLTDVIVVRRALVLDDDARTSFDLSGVYLP